MGLRGITPMHPAVRSLNSAKGASVVEIADNEQYEKALTAKGLCVVYFTAAWCGPCQKIKPIYEQLAEDHPVGTFIKVDVDECAEIAAAAKVRAMPTFKFYKGGKLLDELVGADPSKLLQQVTAHIK